MNRLTYKSNTKIEFGDDAPYSEMYVTENADIAIQKLGMLEDTEEELGCPLEVLFRALIEGIYISVNKNSEVLTHYLVTAEADYFHAMPINASDDYWTIRYYKFSDYKKTWWLREDKSE